MGLQVDQPIRGDQMEPSQLGRQNARGVYCREGLEFPKTSPRILRKTQMRSLMISGHPLGVPRAPLFEKLLHVALRGDTEL